MSKWRFNLRNSKDLSLIGELTGASGKSVTLAHNSPGSANWNYSMSDQLAPYIQPFSTCISAERYNWRATQALNLAGSAGQVWDWIWSGFVMPIDEDWTGDMMKVSCMGWAQRLAMRLLHADRQYTTQDDSAIIQDLLAYANAATFAYPDGSTYAVPTVSGSNPATPTWMAWGGTVPNEGPGGLTPYVARSLLTLKKDKNQMILPVFDELTGYENGCDWWVQPQSRLMYVARKRCARRDGVKYPSVVMAFKWGPNNLGQFSRNVAADQKANYVLVTGSGTLAATKDNTADQATNGLIETLTQWTDANDITQLLWEAGAQIILRQNGRITYGITPFYYVGDTDQMPNSVPEPFVDYNPVGDEFMLKASHPVRGDIALGVVRSFGCTVNIDEENNEQLGQLQVSP